MRKTFLDDAEREFKDKTIREPLRKLNEKIYLDVVEAATLLGLSRMSLYKLIYSGKLKASKLSSRLTVIIRADIDAMLNAHPYTRVANIKAKDITEFYTVKEIKDKYNVCESWIYKVGREKNIPRIFKMGKTYWSKEHVDKFILKNKTDDSITEWYSVPDLMEKFNMTTSAVYTFVSAHSIPKKKVKNQVFYSKAHVDAVKNKSKSNEAIVGSGDYYSVKQIMEKYHMTRDRVDHYLRYYKIPRIKVGKIIMIPCKEFDDLFAISLKNCLNTKR